MGVRGTKRARGKPEGSLLLGAVVITYDGQCAQIIVPITSGGITPVRTHAPHITRRTELWLVLGRVYCLLPTKPEVGGLYRLFLQYWG